MKIKNLLLSSILLFTMFSCSKDDGDNPQEITQEEIEAQVENFVTPDLIDALENLGYTFNDGIDTPDISGNFRFEKVILVKSNIEDDYAPGSTFYNITMNITSLDNGKRTFNFTGTEGDGATTLGNQTDSFFSGRGDKFSAYAKLENTIGEETAIVLFAISGTITDEGISLAQVGVLMLDNNDNPNGTFIANGDGRLLKDEDGLAKRL
ncbi:MAG: hypothetical protein CL868_18975 [Cytophagaceae bacterium]|nr:hypothetical protein [Cytophagaceae bacterium]|tara:strand:- start:10761 stop:11384 length:624 start_codon:yes stop_codon:yes gene_type:complete